MDTVLEPKKRVPKSVQYFLELVRRGEVQTLEDLFGEPKYEELLRDLVSDIDWLKIEDIVDAFAKLAKEESWSPETYHQNLLIAFNDFYPDPQPVWADILKGYVQKIGPVAIGEIAGMVRDVAIILKKIEEIKLVKGDSRALEEELKNFVPKGQKNSLTFVGVVRGCMGGYEELIQEPPQQLVLAYETCYQSNSSNKGGLMKAFGSKVNELYPRQNTKLVKPFLKTTKAKEDSLYCLAVADLLVGNLADLDPVIGDESCEARPPIILDLHEKLIQFCDVKKLQIIKFCHGYLYRHGKDGDMVSNVQAVIVAEESAWSIKFVNFCTAFFEHCGEELKEYLFLCKAATYTSKLASDEWDIVSYDRYNSRYSLDGRTSLRRRLSITSCNYVRNMVDVLLESGSCDKKFWSEVGTVLKKCTVFKFDQKNSVEENNKLQILPIYETMRTVFAYQFVKKRPIVLSIYRIMCTPEGEQSIEYPGANYGLISVPVLVYRPNGDTGNYQLSHDMPGDDEPCLSIQAYQLVNVSETGKQQPDGCDFFLSGDHDYLEGFKSCDISLLTMVYSAVHPPLAGGARLDNDNELPESGVDFEIQLQQVASSGEGVTVKELQSRNKGTFNLCNPVINLVSEYKTLRELAFGCGLDNKQYISRPGGGQVCVRTMTSVGFTIHHINVQRFGVVKKKAEEAMSSGDKQRFHNFDSGKSYPTKEKAEEGN